MIKEQQIRDALDVCRRTIQQATPADYTDPKRAAELARVGIVGTVLAWALGENDGKPLGTFIINLMRRLK